MQRKRDRKTLVFVDCLVDKQKITLRLEPCIPSNVITVTWQAKDKAMIEAGGCKWLRV